MHSLRFHARDSRPPGMRLGWDNTREVTCLEALWCTTLSLSDSWEGKIWGARDRKGILWTQLKSGLGLNCPNQVHGRRFFTEFPWSHGWYPCSSRPGWRDTWTNIATRPSHIDYFDIKLLGHWSLFRRCPSCRASGTGACNVYKKKKILILFLLLYSWCYCHSCYFIILLFLLLYYY